MDTPPQFRPQKRWFYSGRWTKSHDITFIDVLCWKADEGYRQDNPRKPDKAALRFAGRAVTRTWDGTFEWDKENNVVHAPYEAWVDMIRRDPFADAYLRRGEPSWNCLKKKFERRRVVRPGREPEIISISSGESDDSSDDGQEDDNIEDGEEDDIGPDGEIF
ncbi:hypothetical protein Salat_1094700 [Sesamum alatum]|uniref:Uncharacterized protein n=1 Tax=Sesamum alatum TaxID=300844 RepID=A0AAE2CT92_9LAMI|nr:hypothetical protein Salat_1094700 [Sesamum alatum]